MSLRNLPEIQAFSLPETCEFMPDEQAYNAWDAGLISAKSGDNKISILGVIGQSFMNPEGVTANRISAALRSIGDRDVVVDINSPGGSYFEGVSIYSLLKEHPAKVTVRILGQAASAGSVIAMAGDEIQISKAGTLMIHLGSVGLYGNRNAHMKAVDALDRVDDAMAGVYADRVGIDLIQLKAWMAEETNFSGSEAVSKGLADSYLPSDQISYDQTRAEAEELLKPERKTEYALMRAGLSRDERRSLIGDLKGSAVADPQSQAVAGDFVSAVRAATETLKS
ncbi:head maturation protease, ClpP-related [Flexibacterium corallicola]|uniref:head maturation protease, ClpP-related n=1 Tax=Flexibacterium corallicola TaxID=3037259 RepID=UPI00286F395C|nr:head maturation protease, ClpP-related [Pseudovibrio sp. M1P-2-3]